MARAGSEHGFGRVVVDDRDVEIDEGHAIVLADVDDLPRASTVIPRLLGARKLHESATIRPSSPIQSRSMLCRYDVSRLPIPNAPAKPRGAAGLLVHVDRHELVVHRREAVPVVETRSCARTSGSRVPGVIVARSMAMARLPLLSS